MKKLDALKQVPFKLPVVVDRGGPAPFVVASDCELMFMAEGASDRELAYILDALNSMPALIEAAEALQELLADVDGLATEFKICHEISNSSYGRRAASALEALK